MKSKKTNVYRGLLYGKTRQAIVYENGGVKEVIPHKEVIKRAKKQVNPAARDSRIDGHAALSEKMSSVLICAASLLGAYVEREDFMARYEDLAVAVFELEDLRRNGK